jgi:chromosome segregation ATPase
MAGENESDAARVLVRLFRQIEPIAAVIPDLERLGSMRAVENDIRTRMKPLEEKEAEIESRLARKREEHAGLSVKVDEARKTVAEASQEAAKILAEARAKAEKIRREQEAELSGLRRDIAAASDELSALRTSMAKIRKQAAAFAE